MARAREAPKPSRRSAKAKPATSTFRGLCTVKLTLEDDLVTLSFRTPTPRALLKALDGQLKGKP